MSLLKFAGKNPSGNAAGVLVDAAGHLNTVRTWAISILTLYTGTLENTTAVTTTNYDVSEYPLVSLRITNRTGVPVQITPLVDTVSLSGWSLADIDGSPLTIELAPTSDYIIITPNEAPWLNYIKHLRLKVQATASPTAQSPVIEIHAVVRK